MKRIFLIGIVVFTLCGCQVSEKSETVAVSTESPDNYLSDWDLPQDQEPAFDKQPDRDGIIRIKEKMFVAQTNDMYLNPEEYLGKVIQYEGIYSEYYWAESDQTYCSVIRYGPGCCGYDSNAGFEVKWDGEKPQVDDWVEITGKLGQYEENGMTYLEVEVSDLKVLEIRGEEYVYQ